MDPDDLLSSFGNRLEAQMNVAHQMSSGIQEQRITAESPDGMVRVTVDFTGGLADLRLDTSAMRLRADDLAQLVLDTSRRAQAQLASNVSDLATRLYGQDSETARFLARTYTERFPAQPEQDPEDPR